MAPALPVPVEMVLTERERLVARQLLKEIVARLQFLLDMGLDYLTLGRATASLSGGEAQRVKLARELARPASGRTWMIDLGPGAGDAGGQVIAQGTPEDVAENAQSLTGSYLKRLFLMDAARAYARQLSERAA